MKLALFFFPVLDISGMMFNDLTAKHITVDMRVDFVVAIDSCPSMH